MRRLGPLTSKNCSKAPRRAFLPEIVVQGAGPGVRLVIGLGMDLVSWTQVGLAGFGAGSWNSASLFGKRQAISESGNYAQYVGNSDVQLAGLFCRNVVA